MVETRGRNDNCYSVVAVHKLIHVHAHEAQLYNRTCMCVVPTLQTVLTELRSDYSEVHAWTDSMTVGQWINQPSYKLKTFVANRVGEIQRISQEFSVAWHHCPGQSNPADIISRGASIQRMKDSDWLNGPEWLLDKDVWPAEPTIKTIDIPEVRVQAVLATPEQEKWWIRLSKWSRTLGLVRRILSWRYKAYTGFEAEKRAEQVLFRIIQQECFPLEHTSLLANRKVHRDSRLLQFRPYIDEHGLVLTPLPEWRCPRLFHLIEFHNKDHFR